MSNSNPPNKIISFHCYKYIIIKNSYKFFLNETYFINNFKLNSKKFSLKEKLSKNIYCLKNWEDSLLFIGSGNGLFFYDNSSIYQINLHPSFSANYINFLELENENVDLDTIEKLIQDSGIDADSTILTPYFTEIAKNLELYDDLSMVRKNTIKSTGLSEEQIEKIIKG